MTVTELKPGIFVQHEKTYDGGKRLVIIHRHNLPPHDVIGRVEIDSADRLNDLRKGLSENEFEIWFSSHEWWKENSRREDLKPLWSALSALGMSSEAIGELFDTIINAVADEHGN